MKVSTDSWHYRMLSHFPWKVNPYLTYSLCEYFWTIVWTFFVCLVVVPLGTAVVLAAALIVITVVFYPILQLFFGASIGMAIISGIVDFSLLIWLWCWYRKRYVGSDMCSETAGLVASYVSAKHRKICPLLDFE